MLEKLIVKNLFIYSVYKEQDVTDAFSILHVVAIDSTNFPLCSRIKYFIPNLEKTCVL